MIVIGIGTNLGKRFDHIHKAIAALNQSGLKVKKVASIIENPALLPPNAPTHWHKSFLNTAVECETDFSPEVTLAILKNIEQAMGRDFKSGRWAPRVIDLDILVWEGVVVNTPELTIPHAGLVERSFALYPLAELCPYWKHPINGKTALQLADAMEHAQAHRVFAPHTQLVGIVNITPDSFSDGGRYDSPGVAYAHIADLISSGASIIDIGAQSTRPGAAVIGPDAEWARLEPVLQSLLTSPFKDAVHWSIDTFHTTVAKRAIERFNVDWINDVSGGADPALCDLLAATGKHGVFMHSVTFPADSAHLLRESISASEQLKEWAENKIRRLEIYGLSPEQIILDPGIGFGKTARQSVELLKVIGQWQAFGVRILVGHSRKSFIRLFSEASTHDRDIEVLSISTVLHQNKVDFLRVHHVDLHRRSLAAMYAVAGPY